MTCTYHFFCLLSRLRATESSLKGEPCRHEEKTVSQKLGRYHQSHILNRNWPNSVVRFQIEGADDVSTSEQQGVDDASFPER